MAIVSMKRINLVGLRSERRRILKLLHRMGCVELSATQDLENTEGFNDIMLKDKLGTKLNRIAFAFNFLKEMKKEADKISAKLKKLYGKETDQIDDLTLKGIANYSPIKKPLSMGLPGVSYDSFQEIVKSEEELACIIDDVEAMNSRLIEIKSETIRLNNLIEQLKPYLNITAKFSDFTDTKNVTIMLGIIPRSKIEAADDIKEAFHDSYIDISGSDKFSSVVIVAPLSHKEELLTRLIEADYVNNNFRYEMTAKDKTDECVKRIKELNRERESIVLRSIGYEGHIMDLKTLYDYNLLELRKAEADEIFRFTGSTFTLTGWFPTEEEDKLIEKLEGEFTVYIDTREPLEEEVMPTCTRNSRLVSPYEDITNMYSVPNAREIDPNPFVAVFFFLFFGIMVSDAGYGLILTVVALLLYRLTKPRKGEGRLVLIIAMGGISTIIWGIMFGGWFGITYKPLLFDPLQDPLLMLGMSLGIGLIQILFGMGIRAAALFKQKKYFDAICNIFGWYAVFIGIGLYALSSFVNLSNLKSLGLAVALIGLGAVFLGGGIGKKGIIGKIGGGFGNLYGVTGFLSDILSYSRLFGLGLATGVVGMVINQLAVVVVELIPAGIGYVFAIPLLIGGHLFNIALNTLGAYVHNSRLQYIEFFSRFYTGSGHQFVPFGSNTKYVYIDK